jgi:Aldehyde oxidase and xanthine dehydrogenase, a/b hammerhead domain/Molybdopterin-binding domain of aldehyde dehydrogenase
MRPPDLEARPRGLPPTSTDHYSLASDRARFVGEPVAVVVAETIAQAKDASERLEIDYEVLTPVVRAADALKPDAPRLWDDPPGNLRIDIEAGDAPATAAAFARATYVVRLDTWIQRVTGVPMEPRTNIAEYDAASGCFTLHSGARKFISIARVEEKMATKDQLVGCTRKSIQSSASCAIPKPISVSPTLRNKCSARRAVRLENARQE